jgi:hypothetical protein
MKPFFLVDSKKRKRFQATKGPLCKKFTARPEYLAGARVKFTWTPRT